MDYIYHQTPNLQGEGATHWFEDEQFQTWNLWVASCTLETNPRNGKNDN